MPYLPSTKKNWRKGKFFQAYDIACAKVKGDALTIPLEVSDAFLNKEGVLKDQTLVPDNLHPAEGGYAIWAEAMEPTIKKLFAESAWYTAPLPQHSATIPAPMLGKDGKVNSWWAKMHKEHLAELKELSGAEILFVGDSITHGWTTDTIKGIEKGLSVWNQHYKPRKAVNVGVSGDKTQHVVWRLQNGILKTLRPKAAILTIGHNNAGNSAQQRAEGMLAILKEIRTQSPETKIIFIPHFPTTKPTWKKSKCIQAWEIACKTVVNDGHIIPLDLNPAFLNDEGVLKDPALIPDNCHPAKPGYQVWCETMEPTLKKILDGS